MSKLNIMILTFEQFISMAILMILFLVLLRDKLLISKKNMVAKSLMCFALVFIETLMFTTLISPKYSFTIVLIGSIFVFAILIKDCLDIEFYPFMFLVYSFTLVYGFIFTLKNTLDIFYSPNATVYDVHSPYLILFGFIIELILSLIFYRYINKYIKWMLFEFKENKLWILMSIYPLVLTLFSFYFSPYENSLMRIGRALIIYIMFLCYIIIMTVIIYFLYYRIAKYFVDNKAKEEKNFLLELQMEQYKNINDQMVNTRKLRHNFRHHLNVISELANEGNIDMLNDYIRDYNDTIPAGIKYYTNLMPLNAILSHYENKCIENNIRLDISVKLDETNVSKADYCVLIGNLMENAILSCKSIEDDERWIKLRIAHTSKQVIAIQIENTYLHEIKLVNGELISNRHDGEGLGIKSVKSIVEKYNGLLNFNYSDSVFSVKVILNDID